MEWDSILSILKWSALAFAAGLIGYFGKHLGKMIAARFFPKGAPPPASEGTGNSVPDRVDKKAAKSASKLEKKQIKAEKKMMKKSKQ